MRALFFIIAIVSIIYFLFQTKFENTFTMYGRNSYQNYIEVNHMIDPKSRGKLRYILQWTDPQSAPFNEMGVGQQVFIERKCPHANCFVTSNKRMRKDITLYDVIAFSGPSMHYFHYRLPRKRSPHQKYVFVSTESSDNYPMCDPALDGFFNWTWTYRLDSDSRWGYIVVRDINGTIVGPKQEMHWIKHEDMLPVSEKFKMELKQKTKLAAWFVSHCFTKRQRETYIDEVRASLKKLHFHNRTIDIYGHCGDFECSRDNDKICRKMIRDKYYFYMAFENSFSEDYVTEKVLHGMQNNAVPIVYGWANYSRFLPPGSFIDAINKTADELIKTMIDLVENFDKYIEYFRWRNHYKIGLKSSTVTSDDFCSICALVSDNEKFNKQTVYKEFRKWWNPNFLSCANM